LIPVTTCSIDPGYNVPHDLPGYDVPHDLPGYNSERYTNPGYNSERYTNPGITREERGIPGYNTGRERHTRVINTLRYQPGLSTH